MVGRNLIFLSLFLLGFFSVFSQTLILRELISNFYGNELFSALMFGGWLLWVALGSFLFSIFFEKVKLYKILIFSHLFGPLVLYFILIIVRFFKIALSGPLLQIPNLLPSILVAIFSPLPLAFVLGLHFSAGAKIIQDPGSAYFLETLGFIFGGLLLVPIFLKTNFVIPPEKLSFEGQNLIEFQNSPFSSLAVTKKDSQYNFFQNSVLAFNSEKDLSFEEFSHLPFFFHPEPKKALIIGGNGMIIEEMKKYPLEKISFLEIDPRFLQIQRKYLGIAGAEILVSDPRYYLKKNSQRFDIIFLNSKDPSNLFLNRLYTKEFFETVKENLKDDGLFAFSLSFSPSFPNEGVFSLNASIYKTLKSVFPEIEIFPREEIIYLASKRPFQFSPKKIETQFLTENHLEYLAKNPRNSFFKKKFEEAKVKINSDFYPSGYFFTNLFWLSNFYPPISNFLLKNYFYLATLSLLVLFSLFSFFFFQNKREKGLFGFYSMLIAGLSFMAYEILAIFLYQIFSGYIFHRISILISLAMAGLALGTFIGQKYQFNLKKIHFSFAILFLISLFFLRSGTIFLFLSLILTGFLTGILFSLANKLYLPERQKIGAIYTSDLIGAAIGGFLFPILFIPIFGIQGSILILLLLNCLPLIPEF